MTRREISPALIGSVALHAAVAAVLLISWHFTRDLKVGTVTPVTIVSNAPDTDLRAAEQAPQEQTAQVETPVPQAAPEPVPPAARPQPQPAPAPAPKPTPVAKAEKPEPTPTPKPAKTVEKPVAKPQPTQKAQNELNLDALAASLEKAVKSSAKPSSAPKGPPRPETAAQARTAMGKGSSAASIEGLTDDLQRRWNPNCDVIGGREVEVSVTFTLNSSGQLIGPLQSEATGPEATVNNAARLRATSAVQAAAPFRNLPRELYGQPIRVHFDARQACS